MHPIKDYFLIGDLHSAALLVNGQISWLCWPHFDSPSIFASILDDSAGHCTIELNEYTLQTTYIEHTAIAQTHAQTQAHEFIIKDFMVPQSIKDAGSHFLVRKLINKQGNKNITCIIDPKPIYGETQTTIQQTQNILTIQWNNETLFVHLPKNAKTTINKTVTINISLESTKEEQIIFEYSKDGLIRYCGQDFESATTAYWYNWTYGGNFTSPSLERSAITLKLMQYYSTGAIIAAPTTSLPEAIGKERNWDYRYVWIRDATFTLYALDVLGYFAEAKRFLSFVKNTINKNDIHLKLFYTIDMKDVPDEKILTFKGYQNSYPVRIGNNAKNQWQLDMYGSLIDMYYLSYKRGYKITTDDLNIINHLVKRIESSWMQKDQSIWEMRTEPQHYTHSKVMCWVGINRVLQMQNILQYDTQYVKQLEILQDTIHKWIWENCFDGKTLKQHPNTNATDATNFLFVLLHFLDKNDPRTKSIIETTQNELVHEEIFVYRYKNDDGFQSQEGYFLLCSFWYICALASIGNTQQAKQLLEKIESKMNKQLLFSEQITEDGTYLGNYPQAFSHMGYIMAHYFIERYSKM